MANAYSDNDSAFGDDEPSWTTRDPMYPAPTPVAGAKRAADSLKESDAQSSQPPGPVSAESIEHLVERHIDPRVLCCNHCPEPCPGSCSVRPSKRRASPLKVGEYHNLTIEPHANIDTDCQFPDDCFEKFCQECNLEAPCPPECASPCPGDDCPEDDACFDPHCHQKSPECVDGCIDPECTKSACPDQPCFCQKCDAQPCPLGDPNSECHFAHSAPTPVGTIYCYDNAPCHFQEGYQGHDNGLAAFETYPCFSQTHEYTAGNDTATLTSGAPTPALSHSNYTSLESAFASESSPTPGQMPLSNCYLNISSEHCHLDNSCCHGPKRACGDYPSAPQQQLDVWNSSIAQGNGLANNFMNFGFNTSLPTSPMSAGRRSMSSNPFSLDNPMLGFNDQSWMLTDTSFPSTYQTGPISGNKLDFLASAVNTTVLGDSSSALTTSTSEASSCICKWYVRQIHFKGLFKHYSAFAKALRMLQDFLRKAPNQIFQATCPRCSLPGHLRHRRNTPQAHQDRSRRQLHTLLLPMGRM